MPYTLTKTNGLKLTTVQDGTIDSTTDLVFVGKNYTGYGSPVNENFVKLLENFSNATQPSKPLVGQTWFDSTNKKIKVYNGSRFKSLGVVETSVTKPIGMNQGDLWYNPSDLRLYAFNGTEWILVGPQTVSGTNNGISTTVITDVNSNSHSIISETINNNTATVTSVDLKFSLPSSNSLYTKFPILLPGINLPSTTSNGISAINTNSGSLLWGTAASALGLVEGANLVPVADLLKRTELTNGTTYPVIVNNDDGITIGLQQILKLHATNSTVGNISNIKDSRIQFNINTLAGGTYTNVINIDGSNGLAVLPSLSDTVSLGAVTNKFNNLYVTTVTATTINGTTINGAEIYDNGVRVLTEASLPSAGVTSIHGTNNQVAVDHNIGSVTVSLPNTLDITVQSLRSTGSSKIYGNWVLNSGATLQATYADLAERYAADAEYAPGTVLVLGGSAEVTTTTLHGDIARAGIVSTNPAYTLNETAGNNDTHPYIALKGRVPCLVVGPVFKGDILVTSDVAGHAESAYDNDNPLAAIGRALQDFAGDTGIIEVMVI